MISYMHHHCISKKCVVGIMVECYNWRYFFENLEDQKVVINCERYRHIISNYFWHKTEDWRSCNLTAMNIFCWELLESCLRQQTLRQLITNIRQVTYNRNNETCEVRENLFERISSRKLGNGNLADVVL